MRLQIRKIGDGLGLVLPDRLLAHLHLKVGDYVRVTESTDRTVILTACNDDDETTLQIAREVMDEYAETFRALSE